MNEHGPEHERLRTNLGAYVLRALPPEEAAELEAHLRTCARCRAERDELASPAAALADLRGAERAPASLPADLGPRLMDRLAEERDRERRAGLVRGAGLAALAGLAAGVVLVAGLAVTRPDPVPQVPTEAVAVDVRESGVVADADLVDHTWGVEVKLSGHGFVAGGRYRVDVLGTGDRRFPAGEFVGTGDAEMVCNLNSSVLRDDATGFEVRDADGDVVVRSTFA